ncbi:MAG TPA: MFS transporter [Pyrinomonadaceae bacterium]|jgi:MFS family permease|nr:MFS transporter [Pyrinomonadaceae bacterium]
MEVVNTVTGNTDSETQSGNPGIYRFVAVCCSQILSASGTGVLGFGLIVWAYQTTRSVTFVSMLAMGSALPRPLTLIFTGTLVDRYGPRWAILVGNLGSILSLAPSVVLLWSGQLKPWHIVVSFTLASACQSLLWPAALSSVAVLISRQNRMRANGMLQAGIAATGIIAPLVGGLVLLRYSITTLLAITIGTYAVSMVALAFFEIPSPPSSNERPEKESYLRNMAEAWAFLRYEPTLLRLTILFALCTFLMTTASVLLKPLVLSFASAPTLAAILSVGGVGMLLGSVAVTVSGKGATNLKQVMLVMMISGLCIAIAGTRPVIPLILILTFIHSFSMPITGSGVQNIIQGNTPIHLQGRIFSTTSAITLATMPLAYLIAGPLADHVFEPLVAPGGMLAGSVGQVIGVGAGRGIGLLFIISGCLVILIALLGQLEPQKEIHARQMLSQEGS